MAASKTAFVFAGGGSLGAVQVGMLKALAAASVQPDVLLGSSVGAFNAAYVAHHPDRDSLTRLEAIWRAVRRGDVIPISPWQAFLGFCFDTITWFQPKGWKSWRGATSGRACWKMRPLNAT